MDYAAGEWWLGGRPQVGREAESRQSKREIIRRLGSSATQFYRILDQTNYSKSVDQVLFLLGVLECHVEFVVKAKNV